MNKFLFRKVAVKVGKIGILYLNCPLRPIWENVGGNIVEYKENQLNWKYRTSSINDDVMSALHNKAYNGTYSIILHLYNDNN